MVIGRIGDEVFTPILARCEGCGQSALMCEVSMDHPPTRARCCRVCTCNHDTATLARYGQLER